MWPLMGSFQELEKGFYGRIANDRRGVSADDPSVCKKQLQDGRPQTAESTKCNQNERKVVKYFVPCVMGRAVSGQLY